MRRVALALMGGAAVLLAPVLALAQPPQAQVGYLAQRDATGAALNFCDVQSAGLPGTIHMPCHALGFIAGSGQAVVAGPTNPFPVVDSQLHSDLQALSTAVASGPNGGATAANQQAGAAQAHGDAGAQLVQLQAAVTALGQTVSSLQAIASSSALGATAGGQSAQAAALAQLHGDLTPAGGLPVAGPLTATQLTGAGLATSAGQATAHTDAQANHADQQATAAAIGAAAAQAHGDAGTLATSAGQATAHTDAQAQAAATGATTSAVGAAATQAHTDAGTLATSAGQATAHADAQAQATATGATTSAVGAAATQAHTDAGTLATSAGQATAHADATSQAALKADVSTSGPLAAGTLGSTYVMPLAGGEGALGFNLAGLTGSGAVITAQGQIAGGGWQNMNVVGLGGVISPTITVDGNYAVRAANHSQVRLLVTAAAAAATPVTVNSLASSVAGLTALAAPLPAPAFGPTGAQPVSCTISAAGVCGPFTPIAGRGGMHWLISGTGQATCAQEQQLNGGWYPVTVNGQAFGVISYTGAPVNETSQENGFGVPHRLNCGATNVSGSVNGSYTSGSLAVTLLQP